MKLTRSLAPTLAGIVIGLARPVHAGEGGAWAAASPSRAPGARAGAAMAFDGKRAVTLLFGGLGKDGDLNDTWEWDGSEWAKRTPDAAPSARMSHAMAYDGKRGAIVLFGGCTPK